MRDLTHQSHLCDLPALLVAYLLLVSLWDQFRARHTAMLTDRAPCRIYSIFKLMGLLARRLALPAQMPALLAPHTPLWLGVIQPQLWPQVLLLLLVQVQALPVRLQLHLLAPLQLPLQSAQFLRQLGPLLPPTPSRGLPASNNSNCLSPC